MNLIAIKSLLAGSIMVSTAAFGAAKIEPVEYKQGNDTLEGFIVYPEKAKGPVPAILMVHNWLGNSEETKHQAERIASLGYAVFAADIYGKGVRPKDQKEAAQLATVYKNDRKKFRDRLQAGLATLRQQKGIDPTRIIAVGYCFGGTGVLELARSGSDIKGVVSFHGGLDSPTPTDGQKIKTQILVLAGADDPMQRSEDLHAFEKEMRDHHVSWQMVMYGGAVHSFTDPTAGTDNSKGAAYNASADRRSFEAFKQFASELFGAT